MRGNRRAVLPVVALIGLLLGALLATPAVADPVPPPPLPPGVTDAPSNPGTAKPGPTYVITPGSAGNQLGSPTDQAGLAKAKAAAQKAAQDAARKAARKTVGKASGVPGSTVPGAVVAEPAGSTGPVLGDAAGGRQGTWLLVAAGALLAYLLTDLIRVVRRRIR
ncbi:MAG: hypothetical protein ACJ72D_23010 [Marmoricola sp.]